MDVYGQQIEPICSYHTCHHKFSIHGHSSRKCKCRHPLNYAAGVSLNGPVSSRSNLEQMQKILDTKAAGHLASRLRQESLYLSTLKAIGARHGLN